MKKLIVLLLAAAMLACMLCACGSSSAESDATPATKASEAPQEAPADTDDEEVSQEDSAIPESCKNLLGGSLDLANYEVVYEDDELVTLDDIDFTRAEPDYCVKLGDGTTIQMPMRYGDLLDAGWVSEESWLDTQEGNTIGSATHTNANGKTILAWCENPSSEARSLADCWMTWVTLGGEYTEEFDVNGISAGATMAEVIAVWGRPCRIYCYPDSEVQFDYIPMDGTLEFRFDWETGLLSEVRYGYDGDLS